MHDVAVSIDHELCGAEMELAAAYEYVVFGTGRHLKKLLATGIAEESHTRTVRIGGADLKIL